MVYQQFSIYDKVTEIYNLPFSSINEREAIRQLKSACADSNTQLYKTPEDYALFKTGEYDDETGQTLNINPPALIIQVTTLINAIKPQGINNEAA